MELFAEMIYLSKQAQYEKCPNMELFFGLYFPVFGLNMDIYFEYN